MALPEHSRGTVPAHDRGEGREDEVHAARRQAERRELWGGVDRSSVMTLELLAGILVWGGIGWLADQRLRTEPWLFAIGVFVGFAAGLYLIWLRSRDEQKRDEERRKKEGTPLAPR